MESVSQDGGIAVIKDGLGCVNLAYLPRNSITLSLYRSDKVFISKINHSSVP